MLSDDYDFPTLDLLQQTREMSLGFICTDARHVAKTSRRLVGCLAGRWTDVHQEADQNQPFQPPSTSSDSHQTCPSHPPSAMRETPTMPRWVVTTNDRRQQRKRPTTAASFMSWSFADGASPRGTSGCCRIGGGASGAPRRAFRAGCLFARPRRSGHRRGAGEPRPARFVALGRRLSQELLLSELRRRMRV